MTWKVGTTVKTVINEKPVKFIIAEELAFASNRWLNNVEQTRWNEVELIKTMKGKYILRESYITTWRGERNRTTYQIFDNLDQLIQTLDATDALYREILEQIGKLDIISEEI